MKWPLPESQWTESILRDTFEQELGTAGILRQHGSIDQLDSQDDSSLSCEQAAPDRTRSVSGVASFEQISFTGHRISIKGLEVDDYLKLNPIVLASHIRYSWDAMPTVIGTVAGLSKQGKTLRFEGMQFDTDPLSEAWFQKIKKRTIRMVSIGFWPLEWAYVEESGKNKEVIRYIDVTRSILQEISPCAIPANYRCSITKGPAGESSPDLAKQVQELSRQLDQLRQTAGGERETLRRELFQALEQQRNDFEVNRLLAAVGCSMQSVV